MGEAARLGEAPRQQLRNGVDGEWEGDAGRGEEKTGWMGAEG